jgi:hypothetical protein|tara:strand:+ start:179 stop:376 length:198 start_codon:yes stop_codon:yes gene_type:complete
MRDLLLLGGGVAIGYYFANNHKAELQKMLNKANADAKKLAEKLKAEIKEGDRLAKYVVTEDVNRR